MTILSFNEFLEELKTPKEGGMMTPREKAANASAAKKK